MELGNTGFEIPSFTMPVSSLQISFPSLTLPARFWGPSLTLPARLGSPSLTLPAREIRFRNENEKTGREPHP